MGQFYHFFPLYPILLCSMVLIPTSNLWRANPTAFRSSKKARNWQNITLSWIGECTHTQFVCLYGDNLHIITIQKEENLLSHKKIHSLFSGSAYHNLQILKYNHTRGGIWIFFQRLQIIHFCGLVLTIYSGTFGNFFWPVGVDSFQNSDTEIKPFSKNLPYITILMERLHLFSKNPGKSSSRG